MLDCHVLTLPDSRQDWPIYDSPVMLHHADRLGHVVELDARVYHYRFHRSAHRQLCARADPQVLAKARALPKGTHLSRNTRG